MEEATCPNNCELSKKHRIVSLFSNANVCSFLIIEKIIADEVSLPLVQLFQVKDWNGRFN